MNDYSDSDDEDMMPTASGGYANGVAPGEVRVKGGRGRGRKSGVSDKAPDAIDFYDVDDLAAVDDDNDGGGAAAGGYGGYGGAGGGLTYQQQQNQTASHFMQRALDAAFQQQQQQQQLLQQQQQQQAAARTLDDDYDEDESTAPSDPNAITTAAIALQQQQLLHQQQQQQHLDPYQQQQQQQGVTDAVRSAIESDLAQPLPRHTGRWVPKEGEEEEESDDDVEQDRPFGVFRFSEIIAPVPSSQPPQMVKRYNARVLPAYCMRAANDEDLFTYVEQKEIPPPEEVMKLVKEGEMPPAPADIEEYYVGNDDDDDDEDEEARRLREQEEEDEDDEEDDSEEGEEDGEEGKGENGVVVIDGDGDVDMADGEGKKKKKKDKKDKKKKKDDELLENGATKTKRKNVLRERDRAATVGYSLASTAVKENNSKNSDKNDDKDDEEEENEQQENEENNNNKPSSILPQLPPVNVLMPVTLVSWENDIIWSDADDSDSSYDSEKEKKKRKRRKRRKNRLLNGNSNDNNNNKESDDEEEDGDDEDDDSNDDDSDNGEQKPQNDVVPDAAPVDIEDLWGLGGGATKRKAGDENGAQDGEGGGGFGGEDGGLGENGNYMNNNNHLNNNNHHQNGKRKRRRGASFSVDIFARDNSWGELKRDMMMMDDYQQQQQQMGGEAAPTESSMYLGSVNVELMKGAWIDKITWDDPDEIENNNNNNNNNNGINGGVAVAAPKPRLSMAKTRRLIKRRAAALLPRAKASTALTSAVRLYFAPPPNTMFQDPFYPLSLDMCYVPPPPHRIRDERVFWAVDHSVPAYQLTGVKNHFTDLELLSWHRPPLFLPPHPHTLYFSNPPPPPPTPLRVGDMTLEDVSNISCPVSLVEYYDENPMLLSNFGMASRVVRYHRKCTPHDPPAVRDDDGPPLKYLEPEDYLGFSGELEGGQEMTCMENNMCRTVVGEHKAQMTDFLIVKRGNTLVLKEIDKVYYAGQQLPTMKVPPPNAKDEIDFRKRRFDFFLLTTFDAPGKGISLQTVFAEFPTLPQAQIVKGIKEYADIDDNNWCQARAAPNTSVSDACRLVSAERICAFENMLAYSKEMERRGVERLRTVEGGMSTTLEEMQRNTYLGRDVRRSAKMILESVRKSPWNVSAQILSANDPKSNAPILPLPSLPTPLLRRADLNAKTIADCEMYLDRDSRHKIFHVYKEMLEMEEDIVETEDEADDADPTDSLVQSGCATAGGTVVRRIWKETSPEGFPVRREEFVTDPERIRELLKKKKQKEAEQKATRKTTTGAANVNKKKVETVRVEGDKVVLSFSQTAAESLLKKDKTKPIQKIVFSQHTIAQAKAKRRAEQQQAAKATPDHLAPRKYISTARSRASPLIMLQSILSNAINAMWKSKDAISFRNAVSKKEAPDYRDIVRHPIHLGFIREKNDKSEYKSLAEFRSDVQRLVDNCRLYNATRAPLMVTLAESVQHISEGVLSANAAELAEVEAALSRQNQRDVAQKQFMEILLGMLTNLQKDDNGQPFLKPVSEREEPGYRAIVQTPMDLSTVQERIKTYSYANKEAFAEDIHLIQRNCHQYCANRYPQLLPMVDNLARYADEMLTENYARLQALENIIAENGGNQAMMGGQNDADMGMDQQ